jgi:hypothetical protein
LGDLAIRIGEDQRLRVLEQSGEVLYGNRRFRILPIAVMFKEPGGLLKADLTAEGVFKSFMIGEVFLPHPLLPATVQGNWRQQNGGGQGVDGEVKPSRCNGVA